MSIDKLKSRPNVGFFISFLQNISASYLIFLGSLEEKESVRNYAYISLSLFYVLLLTQVSISLVWLTLLHILIVGLVYGISSHYKKSFASRVFLITLPFLFVFTELNHNMQGTFHLEEWRVLTGATMLFFVSMQFYCNAVLFA